VYDRAVAQHSPAGAASSPKAAQIKHRTQHLFSCSTPCSQDLFSKQKSPSFIMAAADQALAAAEGIAAAAAATAAEAGSSSTAEPAGGSGPGARGERFCTVTRNAAATPDRDLSPSPGHTPVAQSIMSSPARGQLPSRPCHRKPPCLTAET